MSLTLKQAPPSNKNRAVSKLNKHWGCLLEEIQYELCQRCFSWNFLKIFQKAMSKSNHTLEEMDGLLKDLIRRALSLIIYNICKFKSF